MPNWAYNTLTIKGTKTRLIKIRNALIGDQKIPDEEFELDFYKLKEDGDFGVKWNACEVEEIDNLDTEEASSYELEYTFNTAWLWPQPVLEAFCEKYPDVEVDYICTEESYAFAVHGWNDHGTFGYHEIDSNEMFHDDNKWCFIDQYFEEHEELNKDDYDLDKFFDALDENNISWEVEDYGFDYKIEEIDDEVIYYDNDFADLNIRVYDDDEFEEILEQCKN